MVHVFFTGKAFEYGVVIGYVANVSFCVEGIGFDRVAVDQNVTVLEGINTNKAFDRGTFPGTVGAKEPINFTCVAGDG